MEEKDADMVRCNSRHCSKGYQEGLPKVWKEWKVVHTHDFSNGKVMLSFKYEPLVLFLEPETSNEEKDRGDTNGARPSCIKVLEERGNIRGWKDSPKREAVEHILKQV